MAKYIFKTGLSHFQYQKGKRFAARQKIHLKMENYIYMDQQQHLYLVANIFFSDLKLGRDS